MYSQSYNYSMVNGQRHDLATFSSETDVSILIGSWGRATAVCTRWKPNGLSLWRKNPGIPGHSAHNLVNILMKGIYTEVRQGIELGQNRSERQFWLKLFTDGPEDQNFVGGVCQFSSWRNSP
jgi:hypothetical protein